MTTLGWFPIVNSVKTMEAATPIRYITKHCTIACTTGSPSGVFIKQNYGSFRCLGLAFVEHYDNEARAFLLHGPVTTETGKALSPIVSESINRPTIEHVLIAYNGSVNGVLADEIDRALTTASLTMTRAISYRSFAPLANASIAMHSLKHIKAAAQSQDAARAMRCRRDASYPIWGQPVTAPQTVSACALIFDSSLTATFFQSIPST